MVCEMLSQQQCTIHQLLTSDSSNSHWRDIPSLDPNNQKYQLPVHCQILLPMAWSHPSCPSTGCPLSLFSRNQSPLDTANIQSHLLSIPKGILACKNCNILQFRQHCVLKEKELPLSPWQNFHCLTQSLLLLGYLIRKQQNRPRLMDFHGNG